MKLNLNTQVSLDNVLKYAMHVVLVFYSIIGVRMLNKTHLENFSNIHLRLALIVLLVLSATWGPRIVCLLLAIAFLMTHQRLQNLKKETTNNNVSELQESSNKKLEKLKKEKRRIKSKQ